MVFLSVGKMSVWMVCVFIILTMFFPHSDPYGTVIVNALLFEHMPDGIDELVGEHGQIYPPGRAHEALSR